MREPYAYATNRMPGSPFGEMFSSGIGAGMMNRALAGLPLWLWHNLRARWLSMCYNPSLPL